MIRNMKYLSTLLLAFLLVVSCSNDDNIATNNSNTNTNGNGNGNNNNNTTLTTQQKVFKEFWDLYDRHYPLMHRKSINWQTVYDTYYPQISATTTDTQLFNYFKTIMTDKIKDGHSSLTYNNTMEAGYQPAMNEQIQQMVNTNTDTKITYLNGSASNAYISYGTLTSNSNIGYIKSKRFEPLNDNDAEFNTYKAIVDQALTALQSKSGIIVDVRTNGGGQGSYAYYLAGRFFSGTTPIPLVRQRVKTTTGSTTAALGNWITSEFQGYADSRAEGGYIAGTDTELNSFPPSGTFQFTNKVAVLTCRGTASSAEYFTAAMKTQSHIKTIGEITFGIFAGSENVTLTNGGGKWKTRISVHDVEIKYNGSYQSFEGIGIAPDQEVIPSNSDVSSGKDVHIDAAVTYINN